MKNFLTALFLILAINQTAFCAEELSKQPEQKFVDNKAVISVQKQPATENTQKQGVRNNWFCIVVQVNGKVLDSSIPHTK